MEAAVRGSDGEAGQLRLAAASQTVDAEMANVLDAALGSDEQHLVHGLVARLLAEADDGGAG